MLAFRRAGASIDHRGLQDASRATTQPRFAEHSNVATLRATAQAAGDISIPLNAPDDWLKPAHNPDEPSP